MRCYFSGHVQSQGAETGTEADTCCQTALTLSM